MGGKLNQIIHGLLHKLRTFLLIVAMLTLSAIQLFRLPATSWTSELIMAYTWLWGTLLGIWVGGKGIASIVASRQRPGEGGQE